MKSYAEMDEMSADILKELAISVLAMPLPLWPR